MYQTISRTRIIFFGKPKTYHLQSSNFAKKIYMLILKHKHQANNLVKMSITNTNKKLSKNFHKDTANRLKSVTELQNKHAILIKM